MRVGRNGGGLNCTRHCLAYSQVSGDLSLYRHSLGGALLYRRMRGGVMLAVGDPLAGDEQIAPLLDSFLAEHRRAKFIQCSLNTGRLLEARGFFVNSFGRETDLVLSHWSCSGKRSHMLRKNFNKAERMQVRLVEITEDPAQLDTARALSDRWLAVQKQVSSELRLLTRSPVFAVESGTRKFASFLNGQMVGIGFFDPLCLERPELGYVYQLLRESPEAPEGTRTHLLLSVVELFRAAGVERLSLGLSPNSLAETEPLRYSRGTRWLLEFARKWPWYNYEGQEFYKSRFGGEERTVFVASRSRFMLPFFFNFLMVTGMMTTYWRGRLR